MSLRYKSPPKVAFETQRNFESSSTKLSVVPRRLNSEQVPNCSPNSISN